MKKLFLLRKSLFIAFAAATCGLFSIIGCAAQKPAAGRQGEAAGGEIRHAQASKALEKGRFVIEANEFYLPEDKSPVKSSTGNYISMEGKRGVISFTPDLFPKTPLGNLTITDDSAEITLEKRKKNGDMQFCMRMTGPANSQDRKVIMPCTGFERTSGISRGQVHGSGKASGRITASPPATATAPSLRGRYREPCIREPCIRGGICRVRRRVRRS